MPLYSAVVCCHPMHSNVQAIQQVCTALRKGLSFWLLCVTQLAASWAVFTQFTLAAASHSFPVQDHPENTATVGVNSSHTQLSSITSTASLDMSPQNRRRPVAALVPPSWP